MLVVGLTGGIGSGKSTVSDILRRKYVVIDADEIARSVVQPGKRAYVKLREEFGDDFFDDDNEGQLNRDKMALEIFSDERKRRKLNSITHPEIMKQIIWMLLKNFIKLEKIIFLDVPLLFETKVDRFVQKTVVIFCDENIQIERIIKRDGLSRRDAELRIKAQMQLSEKAELANYVIGNNGNIKELEKNLKHVIAQLESNWTPFFIRVFLLTLGLLPAFCWLLKLSYFNRK